MTNFIFSAAFAIVVALASVMGSSEYNDTQSPDPRLCSIETGSRHHLTEEEKIDIYEQVMDECVLNNK